MSEDREQIRELIHRHAQLTDDGDVEVRLQLYIPDGRFTGPNGSPLEGHDAIRASFEQSAGAVRSGKHITANTVIELDGERASAQTDFTFFRVGPAGLSPMVAGRYYDGFVKREGSWKFASRELRFLTAPSD